MIRAGLRASLATFVVLFFAGFRWQAVVMAAIVGGVAVLQSAANGLVGNNPLPRKRRPTLLERARTRYVRGEIDVEKFEELVGQLLEQGIADSCDDPVADLREAAKAMREDDGRRFDPEFEHRRLMLPSEERRLRAAGLLPPLPDRPADATYLER